MVRKTKRMRKTNVRKEKVRPLSIGKSENSSSPTNIVKILKTLVQGRSKCSILSSSSSSPILLCTKCYFAWWRDIFCTSSSGFKKDTILKISCIFFIVVDLMQQDEETEGKGNEENGKEGENGAEGENHLEKLICCRDGSIIIYNRFLSYIMTHICVII